MQSNSLHIKQFKHDIASPLSVLKTMIEMNESWNDCDKKVLSMALKRMEKMVATLESKEEQVNSSPYHLIEQVLEEKKVEFKDKSISYKFSFSTSAMNSICHIQPSEFKRVISNIINNSVGAISENGFIRIKGHLKNNKLIVSIIDNGHGIAASDVSRVLDLGFSSKNSTGLGLYHAKKVISKWRGNLKINSVFNLGTKVSLVIPINPSIKALCA
ncbi:sensor histidine kinase [Halobacteriovorax sp.]|uniref:sensor histidine kinase n=1 Tax=Halobacteriovorax sp. TaxID=2020862 RepID=UPI0035687D12